MKDESDRAVVPLTDVGPAAFAAFFRAAAALFRRALEYRADTELFGQPRLA